jgi:hypothetical protein
MRKLIGIAVLLLAITLAVTLPPFAAWTRKPTDAKVGMSFAKVRPALQGRFDTVRLLAGNDYDTSVYCANEPDFFGNRSVLLLRVVIGGVGSGTEPNGWVD